jgi:hypothetical protein
MLHLRLIILSVGADVPVDSETLLMTDFINLKIKADSVFRRVECACVFIGVTACMRMSICVFKKSTRSVN